MKQNEIQGWKQGEAGSLNPVRGGAGVNTRYVHTLSDNENPYVGAD